MKEITQILQDHRLDTDDVIWTENKTSKRIALFIHADYDERMFEIVGESKVFFKLIANNNTPQDIQEAVSLLAKRYNISEERVLSDLKTFLNDLIRHGVLNKNTDRN